MKKADSTSYARVSLCNASCEDLLIHKGFDSNVENLRTRVFVKKVQVKSRANLEGNESAK